MARGDGTPSETFGRTRRQAALFLERFRDRLQKEDAEMVEAYAGMGQKGFWQRRRAILRHGFAFHGAARNVGFWFVA